MGTFTIRPAEQQDVIDTLNDTNIKNTINALAPYSGYTKVSKKLDNFVFQTSSSFLNKVADKNRFVKFGDKVVDTYGPELVTNGDFSNGTTGWGFLQNGSITISNGMCNMGIAYNGYVYQGNLLPQGKNVILSIYIKSGGISLRSYRADGATQFTITDLSQGYHTIVIEDKGADVFYSRGLYITATSDNTVWDNISVREIQTADFTNTVQDVAEVITNGSNVTSVAVSAGDYVVVSPIKLNNSTFDTDLSGWNNSNNFWQYDSTNKRAFLPSTSDGSNSLSQMYTLTTGIRYRVRYSITIVSGGADVYIGGVKYSYTASISVDTVITGNGSTSGVSFIRRYDSGSGSFYVDNVYIDEVSDTFRAKQDAPIGTALTNTTYFEDRTSLGVTNQALMAHKYNTTTNAYGGLHTEVLFNDVSKEQLLDNSVWMANNGFSKVSQFLYSKSTANYLVSGQYTTLNKGLFHPILNYMGTRKASDDRYWYDTTVSFTSVSDCFNPTKLLTASGNVVSGKSGRPTGDATLYYDVCYPSLYQDVREYAKILNRDEVNLIIADKEENGVSEVVFTEQVLQTTTGTVATLEVSDGTKYRVGSVLQIWNGTTGYRRYVASVSGNTVTLDSTIVKTAVNFIIGGGRLPILSSGTSLSIDLIGAPNA